MRPAQAGSRSSSALVDLALFVPSLLLVVWCLVYLPLGLVAAASQDGLSESMHRGLGSNAPVPLRAFRAVGTHASVWAIVAFGAVFHVVLRRLLRWRVGFSESLAWDALSSPALTAVVVGGATLAFLGLQTGFANDAVPAALLAGLGTFPALAAAGLGLALAIRHPRLRVGLAVLLAAAAVGRLGAEAWGRWALGDYRTRQAAEWTAADARRAARERPLLREPGIDEDAWPRYRKLIAAVGALGRGEASALVGLGDLGPFDRIPAPARAVLDAHRAEVAAWQEATRCRRSLPETVASPIAPMPSLLGARYLALLAGLAAHERAQAGNLDDAALAYLQIVRFGGDLGDGNYIHALLGSAVEERGLTSLGRLVQSGRLDASALERIERDRALLEAHRASIGEGLARDRRSLAGLGDAVDGWEATLGEPLVLPVVVPYHALAAQAQRVADPVSRDLEAALARDDAEAWRRAAARADAEAGASWNPLLRFAMGYGPLSGSDGYGSRRFEAARRQLAYFRLVEASVKVELGKLAHGRYPPDASALALPADPFAPGQPLRYERDGSRYRLWSVGPDGIDGGGERKNGADLLL